jgi:hypothetical protein
MIGTFRGSAPKSKPRQQWLAWLSVTSVSSSRNASYTPHNPGIGFRGYAVIAMDDEINLATQTIFAELAQRSLDAEFDAFYDERGNFGRKRIQSRLYWYYKRDVGGTKKFTYVGPVSDKAINERIKKFDSIKVNFRQRRQIVRALIAAGLPSPDTMTGELIEALWKAGFFRLRGVLVGTQAFQCYSGLLGARLSGTSLRTGDADLAQFYDVSRLVQDSMPPILDVLQGVNPSFRPLPSVVRPYRAARFQTSAGYLVEFLTPNRGSQTNQGKPAVMPALGGAAATPLRYLDFLIRDPVRSVVLYKGGVPVWVPSPERYAIHKLIVAVVRRDDPAKSTKDIFQAEQLIRICLSQRSYALFEAWVEATERGPTWSLNLRRGREMLSQQLRNQFIFSLETYGWTERKWRTQTLARKKSGTSKPARKEKPPKRNARKTQKKQTG